MEREGEKRKAKEGEERRRREGRKRKKGEREKKRRRENRPRAPPPHFYSLRLGINVHTPDPPPTGTHLHSLPTLPLTPKNMGVPL